MLVILDWIDRRQRRVSCKKWELSGEERVRVRGGRGEVGVR